MPPIPVHIDEPITPRKAGNGAASAATAASPNNAYPAARPGAAPGPAPTPYAPIPQPVPTRTSQQSVYDANNPAPPQPGAVPSAPGIYTPVTSAAPPPRPGQSLPQQRQEQQQQQAPQPPSVTAAPAQMAIPPPQQNYAPTHSTTTTTTAPPFSAPRGPTTINLGPVQAAPPAQHPSGYQQNAFAQEMSSAQRASLDQQERREQSDAGAGGVLSQLSSTLGGGSSGSGSSGLIGGGPAGAGAAGADGSVWDSVKGWASKAGQTLAETEESVWKRINGS